MRRWHASAFAATEQFTDTVQLQIRAGPRHGVFDGVDDQAVAEGEDQEQDRHEDPRSRSAAPEQENREANERGDEEPVAAEKRHYRIQKWISESLIDESKQSDVQRLGPRHLSYTGKLSRALPSAKQQDYWRNLKNWPVPSLEMVTVFILLTTTTGGGFVRSSQVFRSRLDLIVDLNSLRNQANVTLPRVWPICNVGSAGFS